MVLDGGIDSDLPTALPVLSGGGALGNGRMHGVPQMLECYLQLSGRAGERQRTDAVGRRGVPLLAALWGRSRILRRAVLTPMASTASPEDRGSGPDRWATA